MRKICPNVDWKKYFDKYNTSLIDYYQNFGTPFLTQVILKLEKAINQRKPRPIVLIRFKDSDICSIVEPSEFDDVLRDIMDLCIHLEKYELCVDIKKIIEKYDEKIKKKMIKELMK